MHVVDTVLAGDEAVERPVVLAILGARRQARRRLPKSHFFGSEHLRPNDQLALTSLLPGRTPLMRGVRRREALARRRRQWPGRIPAAERRKWWVVRDLATVAIVGVSDPVWGRGCSQRVDARTGIWGLSNQGLGELRAL